ncbi:hypothetical protein LBMAG53_00320 [Planctomycetota bacterium]|nr:hypothetical protein LBMAG53_00320 [Planctomycetota bacterium]
MIVTPEDSRWPGPWPGLAAVAAHGPGFLAGWTGDRGELATILGTTALSDPRTVAVVAGQQPAVGGGPLYTLVKCATACAVARRLTAAGQPAAAVFWCASEDHDLGEAGHADLVDRSGIIRRVNADLGPGRAALRHRPAISGWAEVLSALAALPGTALGATFIREQQPHADEGFGAWLCRFLRAIFPGLVAVEGHRLRGQWVEQARRLTTAWPAAALASLREQRLAEGAADAFGELPRPTWFADRPSGRTALEPSATLALIDSAPDQLSPSAAIRPILQQAALPTLVFVAGPGELAYHRFLAPLYSAAGVPPPIILPRPSATLIPAWYRRACSAWGTTPTRIDAGFLPNDPPVEEPALGFLDQAIAHLQGAEPIRAGAARRLGRERERLAAGLARRARRAAERPAPATLARWLKPRDGTRQDRIMSVIQAIWQHGPGLGRVLIEAVDGAEPGEHRLVNV